MLKFYLVKMKNKLRNLIVFLIVLSCNPTDENNQSKAFCSVNNPVVDLGWLKAEIEEREQNITTSSKYFYISQSVYNDEQIIIYGNCDPLINSVYTVYNCQGERIGIIGSRSQDFPFEVITDGQIIWKTDDFECSF